MTRINGLKNIITQANELSEKTLVSLQTTFILTRCHSLR